jgi:hypothetical protein
MRPELFLPSTLGLSAPYPQVLKVFLLEVVGGNAMELPTSRALSSLASLVITAQAAFASVPYALFRTVGPLQVEPSEDATQPSGLTMKSPHYCAAFSVEELPRGSRTTHFRVVKGCGIPSVCGVSTFVLVTEISPHGMGLFTRPLRDPIQPSDVRGTLYIRLPNNNIPMPQLTSDPYGCLHSAEFYHMNPWGRTLLSGRVAAFSGGGVVKKRDGYFCFKLGPNTDITCYGMAIVFDNNSPGHHSFIALNVPSHIVIYEQSIAGIVYQILYNGGAGGVQGSAAALFQLCCFKIVASAGIFDLAEYLPDDPRSDLIHVASLLFDQSSSLGIAHEELDLALEELQACKFDLKILSQESAYVLKKAVHRLEESYESSSEIRELCANVLKFDEQPHADEVNDEYNIREC